jgi:hypothetical protein
MSQRGSLPVLANKLYNYYKTQRRGILYCALKLVAITQKKNIDWFLVAHNIHERATLNQDDNALSSLGFPEIIFSVRRGIPLLANDEHTVDEHTCYRLIMAAATILLFDVEEAPDELRPAPPPGRKPPAPVAQDLTLALVLKGVDLNGIDSHSSLSLDDVTKLLEKASYFACAVEQDMNSILSELNLDEQPIDRESEQPVLVLINFQQYEKPPVGGFANKLQLSQHLRQGAIAFAVGTLRRLVKSGSLVKSGFIRS